MTLRHAMVRGVLVAAIAGIPGSLVAQTQQRHGDVNGDGVVSALDAQAILSSVVGLNLPAGYVAANGDANCDAATEALDAQIVLSHVIGLNVTQYCVNQAFGPGAIRIALTPGDTSVLINRGLQLRAILSDTGGYLVQRPVAWTSSNTDLVVVDSARGDTAWVSNKGVAFDAAATLTATADGVSRSLTVTVVRSYAGIVITPQRPDTLRQLNGVTTFYVRGRDSTGNLTDYPNAIWSSSDPAIASVDGATSYSQQVTALTMGATWLRATSQASPTVRDSVRLVVQLAAANACSGSGGTLHATATYTTPQTWSPATNPHYVSGSLTFAPGARLTMEPGTLVCMNSGASMYFNAGARLMAEGTVTDPISIEPTVPTNTWYQIQLGSTGTISANPADTSRIRNVLLDGGYYGLWSYGDHYLQADSVRVRQFGYYGIGAYNGRILRSTIDSSIAGYHGTAAYLGRATLEQSTVRLRTAEGVGAYVFDAGAVRQTSFSGGERGVHTTSGSASARLNDLTISGTSSFALQLDGAQIDAASGNITVSGSLGGVYTGGIGSFAHLYPDSLAQAALLNNGQDTVRFNGGTLSNRTLTLRPDIGWIFDAYAYVDTLAQLVVRPGATLAFYSAGLTFQRGGTLDARGTAANPIRMRPRDGSSYFYGLHFESPGQGGSPFSSAPVALSTMINVRIDSAAGTCCSAGFGYSAVNAADRHRLTLDSIHVRLSHYGGVHMATRGSSIRRSVIDTTGLPTSSYVALGLGDSTIAEDVIVRRSGFIGVGAGTGVRMSGLQILNSVSYGLQAESGVIRDSGSVTMEGNAYVGRMRIENLARLAPDSVTQRALYSATTTDSAVVITGGNLTADTITAIPQLRWQLENQVYVDTLAHFSPRPGARISAYNGGLIFQRGGTLNARGTAANPIRFYPVASGVNFYGLLFSSPGQGGNPFATAPVAQSVLVSVRVDSASGQYAGPFGYAAIAAADRHRLTIDSSRVRLSQNGAVHLHAWHSSIARSAIDTTGVPTASYVALGLGDSTSALDVTVRRSGQIGVSAAGTGSRLTNVQILNSVTYGLQAEAGLVRGDSGTVTIQGGGYSARLRIENLGMLAPDEASQRAWYSSTTTDSAIVITGGTLTGNVAAGSLRTVTAIPQLRWQLENQVYIDTLAQFAPRPGARIGAWNGGLIFQRGGTLNARGTATNPIRFYPVANGVNFYGLLFSNPGDGGSPFVTAPRAQSYLVNVKVDSASGQYVAPFGYAAIAAADRHRLTVDSSHIRRSQNGAVYLAAWFSELRRSTIDTTGLPTTGYVAVGLGDSTYMDSSVVRRSGYIGVNASGAGAQMRSVQIVDSEQYGLHAQDGIMRPGDSVTVTANAYAGRIRLENLGRLIPTAVAQSGWLGNTDDVMVVYGGLLVNDTVTAIPGLRWQVENTPTFGSGSLFSPAPGARITGNNSHIQFDNGGRLYAVGTAADTIRFYPAAGNVNFYGLRFDNPPTGRDTSTLQYVRMDSISGQCCVTGGFNDYAALKAGSAHVVLLSNALIRRAHNAAVSFAARGSSMTDVRIDTTGSGAALTTGYTAVAMTDSTRATNVVVRRSGENGFWLDGLGITLASVRVVNARLDGFVLVRAGGTYSGTPNLPTSFVIAADSSGGVGYSIRASNITLQYCTAQGNASHGAATNGSYAGVQIHNCDFVGNTGNGVNNFSTTVAQIIDAGNNWWGDADSLGVIFDGRSANVTILPLCTGSCTNPGFAPIGSGMPPSPALPASQQPLWRTARRPRRRRRSS